MLRMGYDCGRHELRLQHATTLSSPIPRSVLSSPNHRIDLGIEPVEDKEGAEGLLAVKKIDVI